ncbi:MAG: tetratricopeptide repeat protein [Gemmataceae bacterium]|jgi:tetratricopeptide (TPR) repeat protein|uniref:Tetratricopeptide repeat protein n=1 Tax=Thermogemmata fonticola TaxID=2755323 RepID=A0A7V8VHC4_9BACT|nr:tetratricopeptide repeat protein [Thermogemmata fonticola]MBA2227920.1 tetratricopeptide repeat protein [Thermogemmata fonticola]MCX8140959.1 tetratricopeptide repeat protein [Gemmataceae bacterium]
MGPARRWQRLAWRLGAIAFLLILATVWYFRVYHVSADRLLATGRSALMRGEWDKVQEVAERLERAGYGDHSRLLRAEWLWSRGEAAGALALAEGVRAEGRLRVEAALIAGKCLLALDNRREAYRVLSWVLDQDDDQVDAHRGLAALAYDWGQWHHAERHLQRVAELDPKDPRPYRLLGLMYKDLSRWDDAEQAYRAAWERGVEGTMRLDIRLELAEVLLQKARYEEALAWTQAGSEETPANSAQVAWLRAEGRYGLGRWTEAAAELEAIPREQWTAAMWRCRGRLDRDAGQMEQAAECLERAVQLDPSDAESWYVLAQVYESLNRKEDAAHARQRVEDLHRRLQELTELTKQAMKRPWDSAVRQKLAEVHEQLGHSDLARLWRKAAAECAAMERR